MSHAPVNRKPTNPGDPHADHTPVNEGAALRGEVRSLAPQFPDQNT
jgi:hypothetical protein